MDDTREANNELPGLSGVKVYEGIRRSREEGGGVTVWCHDERDSTFRGVTLDPRLDLRNHSPSGFEWGYGGSGPTQLALAILADFLRDDGRAEELYQDFKWRVVVPLPHDRWTLTAADIDAALERIEQERSPIER